MAASRTVAEVGFPNGIEGKPGDAAVAICTADGVGQPFSPEGLYTI